MDSKLTDLQRAQMRVRTQRLEIEQQSRRLSQYREEVYDLQQRISNLLEQSRGPQCLDDVIHLNDQPGQGS